MRIIKYFISTDPICGVTVSKSEFSSDDAQFLQAQKKLTFEQYVAIEVDDIVGSGEYNGTVEIGTKELEDLISQIYLILP
jgi:hypothetical protein